MKSSLLAAIAFAAMLLSTRTLAQEAAPTLLLHLKPLYGSTGLADGLSVDYELPFPDSAYANGLELCLDLMQNLGRRADTVANLVLTDEAGPVPVQGPRRDTGQNRLVYTAGRKTRGTVRVRYTIAAASPLRRGGSNIDLQRSGGGLSGAFISVLLLPAFQSPFFVSFDWALPPGSRAVSTFGPGNRTSATPVVYYELLYAQFAVGRLKTYPALLPEHGFKVAGLGLTDRQISSSLPVYQKVYEALRKALRGDSDRSFLFLCRSFAGLPFSSGTATMASDGGSFLVYLPDGAALAGNDEMVALVAHEMIHALLRGLRNDWYLEGLADYLSATLPHQAGLYSDSAYLALLNAGAAYYYKNPDRLTPDTAVEGLPAASQISWALSYSRGMLYFANLDAKLKERALVKNTTVLSLALDLQDRRLQQPITEADWLQLLAQKAGDWAVSDWRDMKSGRLLVPYPGAYGPEYRAQKRSTGYFDLGFGSPGILSKGEVIGELDEASNAAKPGLRNGDRILETVDYYPAMQRFDTPLQFRVQRGAEVHTIRYLPVRGTVEAWEWTKKK